MLLLVLFQPREAVLSMMCLRCSCLLLNEVVWAKWWLIQVVVEGVFQRRYCKPNGREAFVLWMGKLIPEIFFKNLNRIC